MESVSCVEMQMKQEITCFMIVISHNSFEWGTVIVWAIKKSNQLARRTTVDNTEAEGEILDDRNIKSYMACCDLLHLAREEQ